MITIIRGVIQKCLIFISTFLQNQVHKVDEFHPQRMTNDKSIKLTDSNYQINKVDEFHPKG